MPAGAECSNLEKNDAVRAAALGETYTLIVGAVQRVVEIRP